MDAFLVQGDETEIPTFDSEFEESDNEQEIEPNSFPVVETVGLGIGITPIIDFEHEKDCVVCEDELRSIGLSSDVDVSSNVLVFREGDEKKSDFKYQTGMIFSGNKQFKWVVEVHEAVRNIVPETSVNVDTNIQQVNEMGFSASQPPRVDTQCTQDGSTSIGASTVKEKRTRKQVQPIKEKTEKVK